MSATASTTAFKRMRAMATGLLLGVFVLFLIARTLEGSASVWGYIRAFAEAGMVGAIADWFAVTAIFRHPLGLPIPHTAIVPRKQAALGLSLGRFISDYFLTVEQLMPKVQRYQPIRRLTRWLSRKANAQLVAQYATVWLQHALSAARDTRAARYFQVTILEGLQHVNLGRWIGKLLAALTEGQRHQEVVELALQWLDEALQNEDLQRKLAHAISSELRGTLYLKSLSAIAGGWSTDKLVAALSRELSAMSRDPEHELRQSFEEALQTLIGRLQDDADFQTQIQQWQNDWLAEPAVTHYVQTVWSQIINKIELDLQQPHSLIQARLAQALQLFARELYKDEAAQSVLNDKLHEVLPLIIEKYRHRVALYIQERVESWDSAELVDQLETQIGKDLQFIRINGTLVGGLVGLTLHTFSQWVW